MVPAPRATVQRGDSVRDDVGAKGRSQPTCRHGNATTGRAAHGLRVAIGDCAAARVAARVASCATGRRLGVEDDPVTPGSSATRPASPLELRVTTHCDRTSIAVSAPCRPPDMSTIPIRSLQNYQVEDTRFFVLVGSQRSGTNFCREVLNTSFQTFVHGEVLLPYPTPSTWHNFVRTMVSRALPPVLPQDAAELVDDYLIFVRDDTRRAAPSKATKLKALGFDIKYNQLRFIKPVLCDLRDRPFLLDYLRARSIPILHMVRRNMLHQALSIQIAAKRNAYHNYPGGGGGGGGGNKITLSVDDLLGCLTWIDDEVTHFRQLTAGMQVLDVAYEDLVSACDKADPSGWLDPYNELLDGIRTTLGVENAFFRPTSLKKVIDRPYREIVANHAEIVAAVAESKFARFADTM